MEQRLSSPRAGNMNQSTENEFINTKKFPSSDNHLSLIP